MSRFSDHPKSVYQRSRTEQFHSATSHPGSEPPHWLASTRPIPKEWCRVQTVVRTVLQRNVFLIYISKSWSKHHSMSSRFRIHLYPTASTAAAGSFLYRALCSFPLPSSCQCPSSGTPPHDVHTAHFGNIALEPVPLPLPFNI